MNGISVLFIRRIKMKVKNSELFFEKEKKIIRENLWIIRKNWLTFKENYLHGFKKDAEREKNLFQTKTTKTLNSLQTKHFQIIQIQLNK